MENGWRLSLCPPPTSSSASTDWPSVWGGNWSLSVGFVATAGVIAGIWPLAGIAVKAVTTSELRSMPCTHTVRAHTDRNTHTGSSMLSPHQYSTHTQTNENMHTQTCKQHLNYGSMLYKISGTFLDNPLPLQSSFNLLTLSMLESHAAFWLFP